MDIFEKNDAAFFEEYKSHLKRYDGNGPFFVVEAKNGMPIICVDLGNENVLRMSSFYDPEHEAKEWAKQYKEEEVNTRLAIYGFGNIYYLRALLADAWEDSVFLVREPDEQFFDFIMSTFDVTDLIKNKQLFLVPPWEDDNQLRIKVSQVVKIWGDDSIQGITMPGYTPNEDFLEMCRRQELVWSTSQGFQYLLGQRSIFNMMYALWNIGLNYSYRDLLDRLPKEMPVIVVAAGPSLLKNGHLLNEFKGRALIIAVTRAAAPLRKMGVEADMVSTIDAAQRLYSIKPEDIGNARVLIDSQGNYEIQQAYKGKVIYANEPYFMTKAPGYEGRGFSLVGDNGGSVATWTVELMKESGFKTIIVVGQDLAAQKTGVTHADGKAERDNQTYHEVEGINGETVYSRADWDRFRYFYEDDIIKDSDIRFIDATEGGALIKGSEVMTLQEVLDTVCTKEFDLENIFDGLPHPQTEEEIQMSRDYITEQMDHIKDIRKYLKEMKSIAGQVRRMMKYKTKTHKEISKKVERLNPIKDKLAEYDIYNFVARSAIREPSMVPMLGGNFSMDTRAVHEFGKLENYCEVVLKGCDDFEEGVWDFINEKKELDFNEPVQKNTK